MIRKCSILVCDLYIKTKVINQYSNMNIFLSIYHIILHLNVNMWGVSCHLGVIDPLHGFEELTEITGHRCCIFLKHPEQRASLEKQQEYERIWPQYGVTIITCIVYWRDPSLFLKFCCDITEQWVSVFTPKWCRILQYECKHDHSLLLMTSFHLISVYSTDHVSKAMLRLSLEFSYILEIWFLINLCLSFHHPSKS